MIHLDLEDRDACTLAEVLAYDLVELGSEIRNTDSHDYRDRLKARETCLRRLLERLEHATAA